LSRDQVAILFTVLASLPAFLPLPAFVSGVMVSIICVIAFVFGGSNRPVYGEPIALMAIVWFLAAGLPVLVPGLYGADWYRPRLPERLIDLSALWLYRAWAAIALGYWVARLLNRNAIPRPLTRIAAFRERAFETAVGIVGVFGLSLTLYLGRGIVSTFDAALAVETSTLGQIASYTQTCSYIFLFMVAARPGPLVRMLITNRLFIANLLGSIAIGAISGTKGGIFAPLVALALGFALRYRARATPWKDFAICAGGFAAVYVISVAVTAYRILSFVTPLPYSNNPFSTIYAQIGLFLKATYLGLIGAIPASPDLLARFSHVTSLGLVFQVSGQESPKHGFIETFLTPIYAVVPRDLMPSKTIFFNSGEMAGLMGWSFGGLSITYPGSIYWSLGYAGIVPLCFVTGWLVFGIHRSATSGRFRALARFALLPLILLMLDVGAEFHSSVINLVRYLGFGALLILLVNALPMTNSPVRTS
jgi:hypothetical protein